MQRMKPRSWEWRTWLRYMGPRGPMTRMCPFCLQARVFPTKRLPAWWAQKILHQRWRLIWGSNLPPVQSGNRSQKYYLKQNREKALFGFGRNLDRRLRILPNVVSTLVEWAPSNDQNPMPWVSRNFAHHAIGRGDSGEHWPRVGMIFRHHSIRK